ncbi:Biotin synthase [Frankliniella fusca]|uniref:Biotin synthase n=1 Tax=Frankliniella fusca TaxID=407009 RepID=A0AAE1H359_9NEOP|nr:Biotin synthase [Frankliniella fusca]
MEIETETPDGEVEVRRKFVCTCCVVDAQARCIIVNQMSPSGHFACPFCLHSGLSSGGAVHYPILPPIPFPERRTDAGIRACMREAGNDHFPPGQDHVQGFKGPSWLMNLAHFSLGKGIVTDDLHPFSGVIEGHTKLLFTRTRDYIPPYYIGDRFSPL